MIKDIYIENFMGFDKLQINNLKKINFLVGQNNCGKTSILESIIVMSKIDVNKNVLSWINMLRKMRYFDKPKSLFYNFDYQNEIKLKYNIDDNKYYDLTIMNIRKNNNFNDNELEFNIEFKKNNYKLEYSSSNKKIDSYERIERIEDIMKNINIKSVYTSIYFDDYNNLISDLKHTIITKNDNKLAEMCSFFNEKINGIKLVNEEIYLDVDGMPELILLNLMGDGLKKYLSIITPIITHRYNTILVDEIKNGLHHKSIKHLLRSILKLSQNNDMQLFFTTHSYEVLKFLYEIVNNEFKDIEDTINIVNIVNTEKKGFQAYNYNVGAIEGLLEHDWDIRY